MISKRKRIISFIAIFMVIFTSGFVTVNAMADNSLINAIKSIFNKFNPIYINCISGSISWIRLTQEYNSNSFNISIKVELIIEIKIFIKTTQIKVLVFFFAITLIVVNYV